MIFSPPETEELLFQRAKSLAGHTLGELANKSISVLPTSLNHAKGWIGQFIERLLGATAGPLDQPDFMHLGIELKTLPVTSSGQPCESTYICTAPIPPTDTLWHQSRVWRKMAKMLWIPIESSAQKPLNELRIGYPILWSPSPAIESQLQQDWEELTELMCLGQFEQLHARHGHYLQIRPKAANAKTLIHVINSEGHRQSIVPKGFYVRTSLTSLILQERLTI